MYHLRPYQQDAVDAVMRSSVADSCLVEMPTGSGKSLVIAELAKRLRRVLVLQPSKELLEQNSSKYQLLGLPMSIYSASVGVKCLQHPTVFATPLSVKNSLEAFESQYAAIILDECHLISPTTIVIIDKLKPERVIGLTATPYTMTGGYIYREDEYGETDSKSPYFDKLVYRLDAKSLIEQGYLTRPVLGKVSDRYDTSELDVRAGRYTPESIDKAVLGKGRLTSDIVRYVVDASQGHKTVMLFGTTVAHCKEILESLPPELSAMIDGETPKRIREQIISDAKALRIKYLVSCETLTTGVDIESVSIIAILRPTMSPVLITQIIGRSMRVYPGKSVANIYDFTSSNISYFFPHGDLLSPEIKPAKAHESHGELEIVCEQCSHEQTMTARPNPDGLGVDRHGYFTDLTGSRIKATDGQEFPAHYGRKCCECDHFWSCKQCAACGADNDIAARQCSKCRAEIIDPNEMLIKRSSDSTCERVLSWKVRKTTSRSGKRVLKVDFVTDRISFSCWYHPYAANSWLKIQYYKFLKATEGFERMPKTVTYKLDSKSGFYSISAFNRQIQP